MEGPDDLGHALRVSPMVPLSRLFSGEMLLGAALQVSNRRMHTDL